MRRGYGIRIAAAAVLLASAIGLIAAYPLLFVALFAFDSPDSTRDPRPYLTVALLCGIPALLLLSCFGAVQSFRLSSAKMLSGAVASLLLAGILASIFFDPLRLRHYPPAQECLNSAYTYLLEKW